MITRKYIKESKLEYNYDSRRGLHSSDLLNLDSSFVVALPKT